MPGNKTACTGNENFFHYSLPSIAYFFSMIKTGLFFLKTVRQKTEAYIAMSCIITSGITQQEG
jgi:hypothetical protein